MRFAGQMSALARLWSEILLLVKVPLWATYY
jgi:hypothetical protein